MRLPLWLGLFGFAFFTIATSLTQVKPAERLVVRRFGKILPERPGPGLHIGLPWGIDQVERVDISGERRVSVGFDPRLVDEDEDQMPPGQLLTGDHNLVNVQAEVRYTVREDEVDRYAVNRERVDPVVARVSEAILAEWIAGQSVEEVLLRGQHTLRIRLLEELPGRLAPYELGIEIKDASLQPVFPPREVRDAFEQVNQAETSIETKKYRALQDADTRTREAHSEAFKLKSGALADAQEQRLQAEADAERFLRKLANYRLLTRSNENYLDVLWLDEMTRLYARMGETNRIDSLGDFLERGGLNVFMSPVPKKK